MSRARSGRRGSMHRSERGQQIGRVRRQTHAALEHWPGVGDCRPSGPARTGPGSRARQGTWRWRPHLRGPPKVAAGLQISELMTRASPFSGSEEDSRRAYTHRACRALQVRGRESLGLTSSPGQPVQDGPSVLRLLEVVLQQVAYCSYAGTWLGATIQRSYSINSSDGLCTPNTAPGREGYRPPCWLPATARRAQGIVNRHLDHWATVSCDVARSGARGGHRTGTGRSERPGERPFEQQVSQADGRVAVFGRNSRSV